MYYCKTHDEKREIDCYSCNELLHMEKNNLLKVCKSIYEKLGTLSWKDGLEIKDLAEIHLSLKQVIAKSEKV